MCYSCSLSAVFGKIVLTVDRYPVIAPGIITAGHRQAARSSMRRSLLS
jgi:hypothetical protein